MGRKDKREQEGQEGQEGRQNQQGDAAGDAADAAGIDIGSTEIFVAVPPQRAVENVRSFATFIQDLYGLADWLAECGVKTVAMESTGVYSIPLFQILEERGFEVGEIGPDFSKFRSASAFASWMDLCPDNEISGGKVLWAGTRKVNCRAATALRMAAQSLHHSKNPPRRFLSAYESQTRCSQSDHGRRSCSHHLPHHHHPSRIRRQPFRRRSVTPSEAPGD
jgi:Transposase IS116/IS110/IS902 family